MRLLEAIIDANHRALAGDTNAGLHPAEFADALPLVALTCIDVRLNSILPQVLGIPPEQFIWLRNAGNIITGPQSSTMRSLSLACAVKGGKEVAIIGHTDCQVGQTTVMQLLEKLRAIGVERHMLPDNLNDFFGMFGSERQNVIKAVEIARQSPLLGPKIPVHGLLVDIETGKLDWLVNGYQSAETMTTRWNEFVKSAGQTVDKLKSLSDFNIGEMKFPETKIGETVTNAENWLSQKVHKLDIKPPEPAAETPNEKPPVPPRIPLPPPIRPKIHLRRAPK
jgi:carbonic anhydrase